MRRTLRKGRRFVTRRAFRGRRRPFRPKRTGAPRMVMYNRLVQPKIRTWLTYVDTKSLTIGASSVGHVFRLNDLYDPDLTGIGHQPAFHDEWAQIYQKYRVLACKWQVVMWPKNTDNTISTHELRSYTGALDNYPYVQEKPHLNRHICYVETSADNTFPYTDAVDKNFIRETGMKMEGVTWKYMGMSKNSKVVISGTTSMRHLLPGDEYEEATALGATPASANLVFAKVGAMSIDSGASNDVQFDIKLRFLVELSEPNDVGES